MPGSPSLDELSARKAAEFAYSPDTLAREFGSGSKLAQEGIRSLYDAISTTDHSKALAFFKQWKILFGEVCGYVVDAPSDKLRKLAQFYGVSHQQLKPAKLLFALHSYYALFLKLLVSDIVACSQRLPSPLERLLNAETSRKLKREMEALEAGSIFRHLKITNFLEGDVFAWYVPAWCGPIEQLVRGMVTRLDNFNPGTLSENPAGSRDLVKSLYHELFPRSVRHDLGEYYTPDWLADHVLSELDYAGDPNQRLLDPACGSGTFLVMAINRIRRWYEKNQETSRLDEGNLCRKILSNVVGFDLNPLGVMAARTNYLIAIRDLIGHVDKVELPVYLCDSLQTPSQKDGSFAGVTRKNGKESKTAANGNGARAKDTHSALAPLVTDRFDFVVGNPPWVLWDNLPTEFRENLRDLLTERYELMAAKQSSFTRLGQAKKDICMAFFYVALDRYCKDTGRLGFVIAQTLFQTTAGDEFRKFRLPDKRPIRVVKVEDWVKVEPFRPKAGNKSAVVIAEPGKETRYPLPYVVWEPEDDFDRESADLQTALNACSQHAQWARPSDSRNLSSFWAISETRELQKQTSATRLQVPQARAGVNTSLESAYKIEILSLQKPNLALVRNITKGAKKPVPVSEELVEEDLILPFFSGESLKRWRCTPAGYYIVPHTPETGMQPIDPETMKRVFHRTYGYFFKLKEQLETRSLHFRWGKNNPFYSLYNIGPYTFSPFRLCWQRTTKKFGCAVVGMLETEHFGPRFGIPNGDVMFLPFDHEEEALYVSAWLNSSPARQRIDNCITSKAHKDIISVVEIPVRDAIGATSGELVSLARECHSAAAKNDLAKLRDLELRIDELCGEFWGITKPKVERIRKSLEES